MTNIYYSPEAFGLRVIGTINHRDEPYEFDMTVYWTDDKGNFYSASDSGCSCPTPFEDFHSVHDLERITPERLLSETGIDIRKWPKPTDSRGYDEYGERIEPIKSIDKETNSDY